jgi:hypothetical protein
MILTSRELLQLSKPRKLLCETQVTETCTNYYANLEDGAQYKPRHHIEEKEQRSKARSRTNGFSSKTKKEPEQFNPRRFPQWLY